MNLQNILNQFTGTGAPWERSGSKVSSLSSGLEKLSDRVPGGLSGGAAAGGIMALLASSKSARKFAGKAAVYGGAAVLGGLAFSAIKNWRNSNAQYSSSSAGGGRGRVPSQPSQNVSGEFQITLIKAMIAAARADGHIDSEEQQRIFKAVEEMQLDTATKGLVFDLLREPISVQQLAQGAVTIEEKSEVYLASCLAINPDHESEKVYLDELARALELPQGLAAQLNWQARQAIASEAA